MIIRRRKSGGRTKRHYSKDFRPRLHRLSSRLVEAGVRRGHRLYEALRILSQKPKRERISVYSHVEKLWKAILGVRIAMDGKVPSCSLSSKNGKSDARNWYGLAQWLIITTVHSTWRFPASLCKELAGNARRAAVSGSRTKLDVPKPLRRVIPSNLTREAQCQLSYLGRALPEGDDFIEAKSLREHQKALTGSAAVPSALRTHLRIVTADWAKRLVPRKTRPHMPFASTQVSLSGGACLEVPAADGGTASFLRTELLKGPAMFRPKVMASTLSRTCLNANKGSGALRVRLAAEAEESAEFDRPDPSPAKVLSVAERGMKSRIVTKSPARLVSTGHPARLLLLKGLKRTKGADVVLRGDHRVAVETMFPVPKLLEEGKPAAYAVMSADLTSASDLLEFGAINAIVEGLEPVLQEHFPNELYGLRCCTTPMILTWPNGVTERTGRGVLMGLPTTWSILSLVNIAVAKAALRFSGVPGWQQDGGPEWCPWRVCGDDLIAVWPTKAIRLYGRLIAKVGGKISKGKHFISKRGGCFTEDVFYTSDKRDSVEFTCWSRAFAVKSLVSQTGTDSQRRVSVPGWLSTVLAAAASSGPKELVLKIVGACNPELLPKLRKSFGPLAALPYELGGLGLDPKAKLADFPIWLRRFLAWTLSPTNFARARVAVSSLRTCYAGAAHRKVVEETSRLVESLGLLTDDPPLAFVGDDPIPLPSGPGQRRCLLASEVFDACTCTVRYGLISDGKISEKDLATRDVSISLWSAGKTAYRYLRSHAPGNLDPTDLSLEEIIRRRSEMEGSTLRVPYPGHTQLLVGGFWFCTPAQTGTHSNRT